MLLKGAFVKAWGETPNPSSPNVPAPEGSTRQSPGCQTLGFVKAWGETPGKARSRTQPCKGCSTVAGPYLQRRSIPNISLVPLNPMLDEQRQELLLERPFPVMLLLGCDVAANRLHTPRANRKHPISRLPSKVSNARLVMSKPIRGAALDFSDPVRLRSSPPQPRKNMHMICDTTGRQGRASIVR